MAGNAISIIDGQTVCRHDPHGAIALVICSGVALFWMIPLHLDLATFDLWYRGLKVLTVPLIGVCAVWVLQHSTLLVKLVFGFEACAATARLGWIFIESPEQLCSSYLIGEQQFVGRVLLIVTAVVVVIAAGFGLFGNYRTPQVEPLR